MLNKKKDTSGVFVPAGLFIGMGVGFLTNQFIAGLFLGLGAGFAAMAIAQLVKRR